MWLDSGLTRFRLKLISGLGRGLAPALHRMTVSLIQSLKSGGKPAFLTLESFPGLEAFDEALPRPQFDQRRSQARMLLHELQVSAFIRRRFCLDDLSERPLFSITPIV